MASGLGVKYSVDGGVYLEKVNILKSKRFETDKSIAWKGWNDWSEEIRIEFKRRVNVERTLVEGWNTFYSLRRKAKNSQIYRGSILGPIHYDENEYIIWSYSIELRGSSLWGNIMTYYIPPDG